MWTCSLAHQGAKIQGLLHSVNTVDNALKHLHIQVSQLQEADLLLRYTAQLIILLLMLICKLQLTMRLPVLFDDGATLPAAGGVNQRVRDDIAERKRERGREGLYASTSGADRQRETRRHRDDRHDRDRDRSSRSERDRGREDRHSRTERDRHR